jgi:hypothetical protein
MKYFLNRQEVTYKEVKSIDIGQMRQLISWVNGLITCKVCAKLQLNTRGSVVFKLRMIMKTVIFLSLSTIMKETPFDRSTSISNDELVQYYYLILKLT